MFHDFFGRLIAAAIGWAICMFVCLPHQKKLWEKEQKEKDKATAGKVGR